LLALKTELLEISDKGKDHADTSTRFSSQVSELQKQIDNLSEKNKALKLEKDGLKTKSDTEKRELNEKIIALNTKFSVQTEELNTVKMNSENMKNAYNSVRDSMVKLKTENKNFIGK